MDDSELIYPRDLMPLTKSRFPEHADLVAEAEMAWPGVELLCTDWMANLLPGIVPLSPENQTLSGRMSLFAIASTRRCLQLAEGLCRELEVDNLFASFACARPIVELIGLGSLARAQLDGVDLLTEEEANQLTRRLLVGSRNDPGSMPFGTPDVINAGRSAFGDHLGEDYGFLSEGTHPNLMLVFDPALIAGQVDAELPGIESAYAELLIKVAGQGVRLVGHNSIHLIDVAEANDRPFPPPG